MILVIRRKRPIGEPPELEAGAVPGCFVLHRMTGAARILHTLAELGVPIDDIVQSVHDTELGAGAVNALDLGRRFETVALGSHLINLPDDGLRRAFLGSARRHATAGARILIEHHPVDWTVTAADTPATAGGSEVGMVRVRRHAPFVSAVSVYDVAGRVVRQPFTARVLSEAELATELDAAGLAFRQDLSPTWLEAAPV